LRFQKQFDCGFPPLMRRKSAIEPLLKAPLTRRKLMNKNTKSDYGSEY